MPPFRRPSDLPQSLRTLNDALHDLHEWAGLPSTRDLSAAIRQDERLSVTASHERVRQAFSSEVLPKWNLVQVLVAVLCSSTGRPQHAEMERFRGLWVAASREARGDVAPVARVELPAKVTRVEPPARTTLVPVSGHHPADDGGSRFALNMMKALADQLVAALSVLVPQPLSAESIAAVTSSPGLYQLFHHGQLVYLDKANALSDRLRSAARKISGRCNIAVEDMSFTCLQVDEDLSAIAPETLLLKRHQAIGGVPWNQNGFGNHESGRQRDGARVRSGHFDVLYPVNLDLRVPELARRLTAGEALSRMKRALPCMFRYQPEAQRSPLVIDFGDGSSTVDNALSLLVRCLGPRWQATALSGHVILYEEDRLYPAALRTYRWAQPE